ncbi:hypothetical protein [Streptomyces albidocamelliae]|uniref:Uncharacterized protein n=1 Tax=Streptomyces albidocamelliae TaxID=2981135 RepID=A0ABY6ETV7_9ACTN|nr:hypothetical protein [Streptomyces sp. HUAS 14-6]UXY37828.1 hypothetical protein N8I86_25690 [Streptomyces sp. HUAS 14-6]
MEEKSLIDFMAQAFRSEFGQRWDTVERRSRESVDFHDDPAYLAIAKDAASIAISNVLWHTALGVSLRASEVASRISGKTEGQVEKDVETGFLVGLKGRHETFLPIWQFRDDFYDLTLKESARVILEVFRNQLGKTFRSDIVISWAATPQRELDDRAPRSIIGEPETPGNHDQIELLSKSASVTAGRLSR